MTDKPTPGMMSGTGHRVYSTREVRMSEEIAYLKKRLKLAEILANTFSEYAYRRYHQDVYEEWKELVKQKP